MGIPAIALSPLSTWRASLNSAEAASILFGPQLYTRYILWQTAINTPEEARFYNSKEEWTLVRLSLAATKKGDLPLAIHFKAFMRRIRTKLYTTWTHEDSDEGVAAIQIPPGLVLVTATLCRHSIHPGNPCRNADVCPVCIMRQCMASLERISSVWRLLGGPHKRPKDPEKERLYLGIKKIWHVEKTRWANLVTKYEEFAALECEWEDALKTQGVEIPDVVQRTKSCVGALEMAKMCPFVAKGADEVFVPKKRGKSIFCGAPSQREAWKRRGAEFPCSPPFSPKPRLKKFSPSLEGEQLTDQARRSGDHILNSIKEGNPSPGITSPSTHSPPVLHSSPQNPTVSQSSIYAPSLSPPPSLSLSPSATPPPNKRVTFASTTLNCTPRKRNSYHRSSTFYRRGRYACPSGSKFLDTSFASDGTFWIFGSKDEEEVGDEGGLFDLDGPVGEAIKMRGAAMAEEVEEFLGCGGYIEERYRNTEDAIPQSDTGIKNTETLQLFPSGLAAFTQVPVSIAENDATTAEGEFEDAEAEAAMIGLDADAPEEVAPQASQPQLDSYGEPRKQAVNMSRLGEIVVQCSERRRSRDEFEIDGQDELGREMKRHCPTDGGEAHG